VRSLEAVVDATMVAPRFIAFLVNRRAQEIGTGG
jgi:hypothetical protein